MVGLIGVVIIVGTLLFIKGENSDSQATNKDNIVASAPNVKETAEIDTDGDGLRDWEEVLWNTDPQKSDSDGDGTPDGEEVRAERDPTISGPSDGVAEATTEASDDPQTATEEFAKSAFAQYLISTSGSPEDPNAGDKIIGGVVDAGKIFFYKKSDIRTTAGNSTSDIEIYGYAIANILNKYSYYTKQDEPTLLQKLLESRNKEDAETLVEAASTYRLISSSLLAISAPPKVADFHLYLTNLYYGMYQSVNQMSKSLEDPIVGMMGLKNARDFNAAIVNVFLDFRKTAEAQTPQTIN